jgi:hypothetical protein
MRRYYTVVKREKIHTENDIWTSLVLRELNKTLLTYE